MSWSVGRDVIPASAALLARKIMSILPVRLLGGKGVAAAKIYNREELVAPKLKHEKAHFCPKVCAKSYF